MVGEWKSKVSGTTIFCEKSTGSNNGYVCVFNGYRAPVTWQADVYTWNYGSVTGAISNNVMTWSTGSQWDKQNVGKHQFIYIHTALV